MNKMKKITAIIILMVMVFTAISVSAAEVVTVFVNGAKVESDVPAVVINGSTMLPFRAIFNALGIGDESIQWNEKSKSIEVNANGKYIFLVIGSSGAVIRDNQVDNMITLNTAPYIENGRTYVPVRFVSESLGATVYWEEHTKTVTINK